MTGTALLLLITYFILLLFSFLVLLFNSINVYGFMGGNGKGVWSKPVGWGAALNLYRSRTAFWRTYEAASNHCNYDYTGAECVKALKQIDFAVDSQRGSHIILVREDLRTTVSLPDHKELDPRYFARNYLASRLEHGRICWASIRWLHSTPNLPKCLNWELVLT